MPADGIRAYEAERRPPTRPEAGETVPEHRSKRLGRGRGFAASEATCCLSARFSKANSRGRMSARKAPRAASVCEARGHGTGAGVPNTLQAEARMSWCIRMATTIAAFDVTVPGNECGQPITQRRDVGLHKLEVAQDALIAVGSAPPGSGE